MSSESTLYLLGASDKEVQRMAFQHSVWKEVTDGFLDRIGVRRGWQCLDVGSGPGFTTADLRVRVGEDGSVTALEPSDLYVSHLKKMTSANGWSNIDIVQSRVEDASLADGTFDLVFARWVLNFVPDRQAFLDALVRLTKTRGIIAVMDYWYEGLSVYPKGTPFERIPDIARAYYASGGGDAYGIGDMPSILGKKGCDVVEVTPLQLTGGKDSPGFRWAYQFFSGHLPLMAEQGVISKEESKLQLENFEKLANDPAMLFFSPIVLACSVRKP